MDTMHGANEFDGSTFAPAHDGVRLVGQIKRIFELMRDGRWRTLRHIAAATNCLETSASTRLRDFRKARFGGHTMERRRVEGHPGLYEYRLVLRERLTPKVGIEGVFATEGKEDRC